MSDYMISNGTFYPVENDELRHYGVLGMRWGVRRNTKRLSSSDSAKREKAIASLQKHREKGTAEIAKLNKKAVKLEQEHERRIVKDETKAAKINQKAAKTRAKASGLFVSNKKAAKRLMKAQVLEGKANALTAKANMAKAKINKNAAMRKSFEREINNIDTALVGYGKKYVGR